MISRIGGGSPGRNRMGYLVRLEKGKKCVFSNSNSGYAHINRHAGKLSARERLANGFYWRRTLRGYQVQIPAEFI